MRAMALMAGGGGTAWAAAAATREVVDVVGTAGAGGWAGWCGPLVAATRGGRHRLGLWGGHAVAVRGVGPAVCGPPAARRQGATADRPGRGPRGYWCPLAFFFCAATASAARAFLSGSRRGELGQARRPLRPYQLFPLSPVFRAMSVRPRFCSRLGRCGTCGSGWVAAAAWLPPTPPPRHSRGPSVAWGPDHGPVLWPPALDRPRRATPASMGGAPVGVETNDPVRS